MPSLRSIYWGTDVGWPECRISGGRPAACGGGGAAGGTSPRDRDDWFSSSWWPKSCFARRISRSIIETGPLS